MTRVLIIEDNPFDAALAREKLKGFFDVDAADTLAGGIRRLSEKQYDALLLDAGLPDSPRQATARALKAAVPHVAFVMYSGYSDPEFKRQCIRENAAGYIDKGIGDRDPAAFASQIRTAILVHEAFELCQQMKKPLTAEPSPSI